MCTKKDTGMISSLLSIKIRSCYAISGNRASLVRRLITKKERGRAIDLTACQFAFNASKAKTNCLCVRLLTPFVAIRATPTRVSLWHGILVFRQRNSLPNGVHSPHNNKDENMPWAEYATPLACLNLHGMNICILCYQHYGCTAS